MGYNKIFGIEALKTGTGSLGKAFEKLKKEVRARKNKMPPALWKTLFIVYKLPEIFNRYNFVRYVWYFKLRLRTRFSRKIKVGFGHIIYIETEKKDSAERRLHIEPIVNYINKKSKKYVAGVYFPYEDLSRFDIIIIIRNFDFIEQKKIEELKKNKILVYNIRDNPVGCKKSYEENPSFIKSMDGIILSNPLQDKNIKKYNPNLKLILGTSVINQLYKEDYKNKEPIKLYWNGHEPKMVFMKRLYPVIRKLIKDTNHKIQMIYHTNVQGREEGICKYVRWNAFNWEEIAVNSDIGVVIKPLNNKFQQRKPPTKIISYMAAGLPVVCTPSAADKLVIKHGKTGFFAYTDEEWYKYLKILIENPKLREKMGNAARKYVTKNFSIENISKQYIDFFNELIEKKSAVK